MKSYVSMEQYQCFVCGELFETGSILLDTRLRERMGPSTVTGTGICPTHQKMLDDGFIILVGCDEATQKRTGEIVQIKKEAWPAIFHNTPVPPKGIGYVTPDALVKLARIAEDTNEAV